MKRLLGKTAIITGANTGVGAETARVLSREGANVVINYIQKKKMAEELINEIKRAGGNAISIKGDVSKMKDVDKMVQVCLREFGAIDILVNNAAINGPFKSMINYTEDEWDLVIKVNLKGPFLMMNRIIPEMLKLGKGKIINISSVSIIGEKGVCAYCASKGGIASLTKTISLEYASKGININAVCPGSIDTEMMQKLEKQFPGSIAGVVKRTPAGRLAKPNDIANAILFLASEESNFINGILLFVDGSIINNVWQDDIV